MHKLPMPSSSVRLITEAFKARGIALPLEEAQDLVASVLGRENWGALSRGGLSGGGGQGVHRDAVTSWPVLVLVSRHCKTGQPLWLLPQGATITSRQCSPYSWYLIEDGDAVQLPDGMHLRDWFDSAAIAVATHVACDYPSAARYGIPKQANVREVAGWINEELGCSFVADERGASIVGVTIRERGDDGAVHWWAEVKVRPDVHQRLVAQMQQDRKRAA